MLECSGIVKVFSRWILISCGNELSDYYRSLYRLEYPYKPKPNRPLWGAHVSIIRDENGINELVRTMWEGITINFFYKPDIKTNGVHFWFPAYCDKFNIIRLSCSLKEEPIVPYHLSLFNICDGIGMTKEENYSDFN